MTQNAPGPLGPTEHHKRLLEKVGEWQVECRYFTSPADEPIAAIGTDRVEALGPFWTTGHFQCDVMGTVIRGMATTGYDPLSRAFIGTWQDSSNPYFYYFEGGFDADGALVMEGDNVDPMRGTRVRYRSVERLGKDQRSLELYIAEPKKKAIKILEYAYTRI